MEGQQRRCYRCGREAVGAERFCSCGGTIGSGDPAPPPTPPAGPGSGGWPQATPWSEPGYPSPPWPAYQWPSPIPPPPASAWTPIRIAIVAIGSVVILLIAVLGLVASTSDRSDRPTTAFTLPAGPQRVDPGPGGGAESVNGAVTFEEQWRVQSPTYAKEDAPAPTVGETAFAIAGEVGGVWAFDPRDGSPLWQVEDAFLNTPTAPALGGGDELVLVGTFSGLTALDAATGAVRWTWGDVAVEMVSSRDTPLVLAATQDEVVALDSETGAELWSVPLQSGLDTAVLTDQVVLAGGGEVQALSAETGEQQWATPFAPTSIVSGLLVADSIVYATSNDGLTAAFDRGSGEELWATGPASNDSVRAVPVAAYENSAVWVRAWRGPGVDGLAAATGERLWSDDEFPGPTAATTVGSDLVAVSEAGLTAVTVDGTVEASSRLGLAWLGYPKMAARDSKLYVMVPTADSTWLVAVDVAT